MTDDDRVLLGDEVAELLRCSPAQVRTLWRRKLIKRVPPMRPPRYTRASVERLIAEDYHAPDAQSDRQAPSQETPPRRGDGRQAHGPLAGEAVGGGSALHRRIGPAPTDVVVRRVPR
jgi:hypothetical protein